MEIEIKGNMFKLLPQKAIYWKIKKTILISDLHLGKVTHFRKAGFALPSGAFVNNFIRLDEIIDANETERIIFLGDLFHNVYNDEWELFESWRMQFPSIEIIIALGNHDILPLRLFTAANIKVMDELREEDFLFTHHPPDQSIKNIFTFCGHIHPVYCLKSKIKQNIKLPCFVIDKTQSILPSFGVFTGGYEMKAQPGRKVFVIAENKVFRI